MYFITTEHWLCRNFCKTKQSDVFYIDIVSNSTVSLLNGSVYVIGVTIYRKDSHHDHVAVELRGVVHVSPCLHVCTYARVHVCTFACLHVYMCALVHACTCACMHVFSCARVHVYTYADARVCTMCRIPLSPPNITHLNLHLFTVVKVSIKFSMY